MEGGPRFVAAALVGTLAALMLVALADGAGRRGAARVTLQIAPRGLGTVSLSPAGLDESNQLVKQCKQGEGSEETLKKWLGWSQGKNYDVQNGTWIKKEASKL